MSFFKKVDEYGSSFLAAHGANVMGSTLEYRNGKHKIREESFHTMKDVITRPESGNESMQEVNKIIKEISIQDSEDYGYGTGYY